MTDYKYILVPITHLCLTCENPAESLAKLNATISWHIKENYNGWDYSEERFIDQAKVIRSDDGVRYYNVAIARPFEVKNERVG